MGNNCDMSAPYLSRRRQIHQIAFEWLVVLRWCAWAFNTGCHGFLSNGRQVVVELCG